LCCVVLCWVGLRCVALRCVVKIRVASSMELGIA
jgi:hypothetical protein